MYGHVGGETRNVDVRSCFDVWNLYWTQYAYVALCTLFTIC